MKTILFQGDSITDAGRPKDTDVHLGHGYPVVVAGELSYKEPGAYHFYNRGISGNRVVDLYARIRIDMIRLKPDYMSILVGVNDAWHEYTRGNGVDAQKYELVYSLMIEELVRDLPDLKLMILEPFVLPGSATVTDDENPNRWEFFSSEVPLRAQAAKRVAEKYGLTFVPLQNRFDELAAKCSPTDLLYDGVHPTPAGHELIKRAWLEGFGKSK